MHALTIHFLLWIICLCGPPLARAGLTFPESAKESPAPAKAGLVIVDFPFSNESAAPVVIRTLRSSCHCLIPEIIGGKLRYAPGEQGILRARVKFENVTRTLEEKTLIWLEGDPEHLPSATLTVRFVVPETLTLDPRNLSWTIGEAATPKVIRIRADDKQPVHLTKTELSQAKFRYTVRTVAEGREYEIEIRPVDTAAVSFTTLRIETDSPLARYKSLTIILSVQTPRP
jgi:hypothetical protein